LDVDCTLLTGFGLEERYVDELLAAFAGRVDHPRAFALAHRVLLLHGPSRVPLDIALGAMAFEERCVERASAYPIGDGESLTMCSAEDSSCSKRSPGVDETGWTSRASCCGRRKRWMRTRSGESCWRELIPLLELKG
jgi:hypothetical protein